LKTDLEVLHLSNIERNFSHSWR